MESAAKPMESPKNGNDRAAHTVIMVVAPESAAELAQDFIADGYRTEIYDPSDTSSLPEEVALVVERLRARGGDLAPQLRTSFGGQISGSRRLGPRAAVRRIVAQARLS